MVLLSDSLTWDNLSFDTDQVENGADGKEKRKQIYPSVALSSNTVVCQCKNHIPS